MTGNASADVAEPNSPRAIPDTSCRLETPISAKARSSMISRRFHRARCSGSAATMPPALALSARHTASPIAAPSANIAQWPTYDSVQGGSTFFEHSLPIESEVNVLHSGESIVRAIGAIAWPRIHMKRSVMGLITALTVTASVGQAADLKIENGPRISIACTGVLETRNGIYFFNREKLIKGLTSDDEIACWGASILPNDKSCWPSGANQSNKSLRYAP